MRARASDEKIHTKAILEEWRADVSPQHWGDEGVFSEWFQSVTARRSRLAPVRPAPGAPRRHALAAASAKSHPDTYDRARAARNLWDRCGPIDGTHAEAYPPGDLKGEPIVVHVIPVEYRFMVGNSVSEDA